MHIARTQSAFEPTTYRLQGDRSTAELRGPVLFSATLIALRRLRPFALRRRGALLGYAQERAMRNFRCAVIADANRLRRLRPFAVRRNGRRFEARDQATEKGCELRRPAKIRGLNLKCLLSLPCSNKVVDWRVFHELCLYLFHDN